MLGTAVFRVDASPKIGGGHLARSLTLADGLNEAGWRTIIAARTGSREMLPDFSQRAHEWLILTNEDEKPELRKYCSNGVELLVVDHYGLGADFEAALRPWTKRVLVIDDLANRQYDANYLLDPTFGRVNSAYRHLVPEHCRMLLGPKFALLRPSFARWRQDGIERRKVVSRPLRLLITLGVGDTGGLAGRIASHIVERDRDVAVEIVGEGESENLFSKKDGRISISGMVRDMAGVMAAADLSVGAAGGTSWERCCMGLPSVVVVLAENQMEIASVLKAAGAIDCVQSKEHADIAVAVAEAVEVLLGDDSRRLAMGDCAAAICDGNGVKRVVAAILEP